MTTADIILIFIGIISLLIAFVSFVITLLAFLDRDRKHRRKNNAHPVATRVGASH